MRINSVERTESRRRVVSSHRYPFLVLMSLALTSAGCRSATPSSSGNKPASAPASQAPALETPFDVIRYETKIVLDVDNKSVVGETKVVFSHPGPGPRELRFPHNDMNVDGVIYQGKAAAYGIENAELVIPLVGSSRLADERVRIAFHSASKRGLVFGDKLVYTNFFTCHWMPCREEPGDKAAFALEVVAPAGYRVVASGRLVGEHTDSSGRVHSRWEEKRPYSPYLFGFAAGDLIETGDNAGPVKLRFIGLAASESAESLRHKFNDTSRMLTFLHDRMGLPLPHETYTQILVPGSEAQEKSSFAVIGADFLDPILEDPTEDWVVIHELAHQWWGNLITCRDWSHFWLQEGMATFLVAAYKEQRWGEDAYERELALCQKRWNTAIDAGFDVPLAYAQEYPSLRIRRAIQYSKAALFLHELRDCLGERAFWAGVAAFTRKYAGGTVTSADFQKAMQEASKIDLSGMFQKWVYP
jgi:aminopeptidase N